MSLFILDQVQFRHVLNIDHLNLPTNRVICIVGRSGSGKSTLLRLINRMITPDTGTITYRSVNQDDINPVELRRKVVMLPQDPVIFDGSIRENVLKGLEFSDRDAVDEAHVQHLLNRMEIGHDPSSRASRLSGGERQRVAIARVLAMQPDVLLLDEPSSALDVTTQDVVIRNVVEETQRTHTSLIMVTHSLEIADTYGELIIEIDAGQIINIEIRHSDG